MKSPVLAGARVHSVVQVDQRYATLPQMQAPLKPNGDVELYGRMPEALLAAIILPPRW
jgi:hypothetical protein